MLEPGVKLLRSWCVVILIRLYLGICLTAGPRGKLFGILRSSIKSYDSSYNSLFEFLIGRSVAGENSNPGLVIIQLFFSGHPCLPTVGIGSSGVIQVEILLTMARCSVITIRIAHR